MVVHLYILRGHYFWKHYDWRDLSWQRTALLDHSVIRQRVSAVLQPRSSLSACSGEELLGGGKMMWDLRLMNCSYCTHMTTTHRDLNSRPGHFYTCSRWSDPKMSMIRSWRVQTWQLIRPGMIGWQTSHQKANVTTAYDWSANCHFNVVKYRHFVSDFGVRHWQPKPPFTAVWHAASWHQFLTQLDGTFCSVITCQKTGKTAPVAVVWSVDKQRQVIMQPDGTSRGSMICHRKVSDWNSVGNDVK